MKALVLLAAALALSCCSPSRAPVHVRSTDIHRFHVGALDAIALKDGDIHVPNDGRTFGVGQSPQAVASVLAAAGLPTDDIELSIQALVVRDGARTSLFDAGAASAPFARAGRLPDSLRIAGITPSQITDVFVSHGHPDHVGGLVTASGTLAFPHARIHVSAAEWESMQANPEQKDLVRIIGPSVATFAPDAVILPGVTAVSVPGHTPGHSAFRIGSGRDQLLFIGDAAHHSVISLQRPEWTVAFDVRADVAQGSRRALLQRAADEGWRVYSGHFPFPGLGQVRARGDGFVWLAEGRPQPSPP